MPSSMLILLVLVSVGFVAEVLWVRRVLNRRAASAPAGQLQIPGDDLPPSSAVGWPPAPGGAGFTTYVDDGFAALDAYLSEDSTS
jgi:hypothetical protein